MKRLLSLLLALGLMFSPSVGWAHSGLTGSSPKVNQSVSTSPTSIKLTFSEPLMNVSEGANVILLTKVGGAKVATAKPTLLRNQLSVKLTRKLSVGKYRVNFRVISADGHPISGNYTFSVVKR